MKPARTLSADTLLAAYAAGVFPMAERRDDPDVFWVDPHERGILPLEGFHVSRSLARRMRRGGYEVTLDRDVAGVIDGCAARRVTWISEDIRDLTLELARRGFAHSFEIWQDGRLAGGTYGVALGGAWFGESKFGRATDASKLVLAHCIDHLRRTGFKLFDTQFLTPHLASLGAVEIPRAEYRARLRAALDSDADILGVDLDDDPRAVLARLRR